MENIYKEIIESNVELDISLEELDYDLEEMGLDEIMADFENPTVGDLFDVLENGY